MKRFTISFLFLIIMSMAYAQQKTSNYPEMIDGPTIVITATKFQVTHPENLMNDPNWVAQQNESTEIREMHDRDNRKPQTFVYTVDDGPQYGNDPKTIQRKMGSRKSATTLTSWSGQNGGSEPQDPTGAVGLTQYVQAVNATPFAVYSKTGTGTAVFTGSVGTATGAGTDGDPIVLYDKFADRWLLAELNGYYGFAVAVSKTNNPAGAWNAYQFTLPSNEVPDYLKFSVWDDGYYMTSNNGHGTVYCLERAAMLTGSTSARTIIKTFTTPTNAGFGFWLPLPGDADGVIPPSGQRCPLFAYTDNGWGSGSIDGIKIWSMGVTWGTNPTGTVTLDATISCAAFDASYNSSWNDITQPGSQMLDGLGGVCMYRAQWNSFIGTNRVVLNWAVKLSTTQRSIKWVELRQNQTTLAWSLYQEGIYAPDATNRWCGSIAMDCNGNIGLCYAKTSSTIPVSLAYTGRLDGDTLGKMTLGETVVYTGTGQITGSNRFGDYSHTSLDPVHNDIFWHTGMYSHSGSRTAIYSFQIQPYTPSAIENNVSAPKPDLLAYLDGKTLNIKASNLPSDDQSVIQLYDISGKLIKSSTIVPISNSFESTIDVNKLPQGTYIVRIGTPKYQRVTKVVIP